MEITSWPRGHPLQFRPPQARHDVDKPQEPPRRRDRREQVQRFDVRRRILHQLNGEKVRFPRARGGMRLVGIRVRTVPLDGGKGKGLDARQGGSVAIDQTTDLLSGDQAISDP